LQPIHIDAIEDYAVTDRKFEARVFDLRCIYITVWLSSFIYLNYK